MTRTLLVDAILLACTTALNPPGVLGTATNALIVVTLGVCAWRLRLRDDPDDPVTVP